jgi:predicted N-acetyltransferase YhbS
MNIRILEPGELAWVNECYRKIDFKESPPSDIVAIAEYDGNKAGLGRIVPVARGIGELGGMHVFPDHQGKGIAAHIVGFLIGQQDFSSLYCIPFAHLAHFYRRHGFVDVNCAGEVPPPVAEKYAWCTRHYSHPVVLLHRAGVNP